MNNVGFAPLGISLYYHLPMVVQLWQQPAEWTPGNRPFRDEGVLVFLVRTAGNEIYG